MRFLCIKEIYSVRPILLKPSENMLPTYGHKFGECSRDVQTLRLFECHLAVANCTAFSNITIRFSAKNNVSSFHWPLLLTDPRCMLYIRDL